MGSLKKRASASANGSDGTYRPTSMELIVCRDTSTSSASAPWESPRFSRSSRTRFFTLTSQLDSRAWCQARLSADTRPGSTIGLQRSTRAHRPASPRCCSPTGLSSCSARIATSCSSQRSTVAGSATLPPPSRRRCVLRRLSAHRSGRRPSPRRLHRACRGSSRSWRRPRPSIVGGARAFETRRRSARQALLGGGCS